MIVLEALKQQCDHGLVQLKTGKTTVKHTKFFGEGLGKMLYPPAQKAMVLLAEGTRGEKRHSMALAARVPPRAAPAQRKARPAHSAMSDVSAAAGFPVDPGVCSQLGCGPLGGWAVRGGACRWAYGAGLLQGRWASA